jgi:hypothetical protein
VRIDLAIECAELIDQLYRSNFEPTISEPATDTQVQIVERAPGTFYVIFPGTVGVQDLSTDLKVRKAEWLHDGSVHRGFMTAYISVMAQIVGYVAPAKRIIITGHSLGGALATLCADDLANLHFPVAEVCTFGSPRVGNGSFARHYNEELEFATLRFVNAGDPVPHVPWVFGTYRHVGTQAYLDRDGGLLVAAPVRAAWEEFQTKLATEDKSASLFGQRHGIAAYLRKLKGIRS